MGGESGRGRVGIVVGGYVGIAETVQNKSEDEMRERDATGARATQHRAQATFFLLFPVTLLVRQVCRSGQRGSIPGFPSDQSVQKLSGREVGERAGLQATYRSWGPLSITALRSS